MPFSTVLSQSQACYKLKNTNYLVFLNAHIAHFLKIKSRRRKKREKRALQKSLSFRTLPFLLFTLSIIH